MLLTEQLIHVPAHQNVSWNYHKTPVFRIEFGFTINPLKTQQAISSLIQSYVPKSNLDNSIEEERV